MKNKTSLFKLLFPTFLLISTMLLVSCEPAAQSASQAFDNANSVIKSGSDLLFVKPSPTPVAIGEAK